MVEIRNERYKTDGTVEVEVLEITITWEEIFVEREMMMKNTDSFVLPDRGLTESQFPSTNVKVRFDKEFQRYRGKARKRKKIY